MYSLFDILGCGNGKFTCTDGSCIHIKKKCDHVIDCKDGIDEKACRPLNQTPDNPPLQYSDNQPDNNNKGSLPKYPTSQPAKIYEHQIVIRYPVHHSYQRERPLPDVTVRGTYETLGRI